MSTLRGKRIMEFRELNKKEMGARIRARREALNMSRSELGKLLSVTGKFIADIEYGDKGVSLKNLYRLKQVLGVSADYILEGDETYISADEKKKRLSENIMGMLGTAAQLHGADSQALCRRYRE